jgi:hypothetical protein
VSRRSRCTLVWCGAVPACRACWAWCSHRHMLVLRMAEMSVCLGAACDCGACVDPFVGTTLLWVTAVYVSLSVRLSVRHGNRADQCLKHSRRVNGLGSNPKQIAATRTQAAHRSHRAASAQHSGCVPCRRVCSLLPCRRAHWLLLLRAPHSCLWVLVVFRLHSVPCLCCSAHIRWNSPSCACRLHEGGLVSWQQPRHRVQPQRP